MEFNILDQTAPLYPKNINIWDLPFIIAMFLMLPMIFYLPSWVIMGIMGTTFLIAVLGRMNGRNYKSNIIGTLVFDDENINVNKMQDFLLVEIQSLKLTNNGFVGMEDMSKDSTLGTTGIAEIEITDKDKATTTVRFLVENKVQYLYLKEVLRKYYLAKIPIKESYGYKTKALLLEPLRFYKQTKALKEELGL